MPQSKDRKREYNRERNRRLRGYSGVSHGGGDSKRGVVPSRYDVVPPFIRDVVPMNPATMSRRRLVTYLEYVGSRGFALVNVNGVYSLIAVGTGELVPFDSVAILSRQMTAQGQRITQLEADLARLEAMMDSTLAEEQRA